VSDDPALVRARWLLRRDLRDARAVPVARRWTRAAWRRRLAWCGHDAPAASSRPRRGPV